MRRKSRSMFARFLPQSTRPIFSAERTVTSTLSGPTGRRLTSRFSPQVAKETRDESRIWPAAGSADCTVIPSARTASHTRPEYGVIRAREHAPF